MIRKRFEIMKDHWIMLQAAVDESLAAIFPAGKLAVMQKVDLTEKGDWVEVLADPMWFEDMKAALAAHPEPEVGEYYIGDLDTLLEMSEDVYEPTSSEAGQSLVEFSLVLLLAAVALIFLAVLIGPAFTRVVAAPVSLPPGIELPERLGDLPMTEHALKQHAGQKYNALNLVPMWDENGCRRKLIYFCPKTEEIKFFCEIEPAIDGKERWGGIVVGYRGNTPLKVVTAYPDDMKDWVRKCFKEGCFPMALP